MISQGTQIPIYEHLAYLFVGIFNKYAF